MTEDDRFEQFLRDAAADYQAPRTEVPRDEMWAAIRAELAAARAAAPSPVRVTPWRRRPLVFAVAGMAATLLVGVAIGRYATRNTTAPAIAASPVTDDSSALPSTVAVAPDAPVADPLYAAAPANGGARNGSATPTVVYNAVASRHLASVEALLTSYEASKAAAHPDTLLGAWAKSLLSDTRLLIDSPVAQDPTRARLLSDLELILVQLVQRASPADTSSRAAVERTLEKKQIIPRLRSAVPASLLSGTD